MSIANNTEEQMRNSIWSGRTRRIVVFVMIVAAGIAIYLSRSVLPNLIIAGLMAIIARPIIAFFHGRVRLPRGGAIIVTYLLMLAVVILLPLLLVAMMASLVRLGVDLTEVVASIREWLIVVLENLRTVEILGLSVNLSSLIDPILITLQNLSLADLMPSPEQTIAFITSAFGTTAWLAIQGVGLVISVGFAVFITFTYAIYISADGDKMANGLVSMIPPGYEQEVTTLAQRILNVWKGYVLGQLGVMVAVGLITWLVTWLIGVPQSLALGVIAGVLEIIPTLGPILAGVPAVLIALFQGSLRFEINNIIFAVIVIVAYLIIQKIEDTVLTPNIQGRAVELAPLLVVVSVMVGFNVGGFLGAIVAIPVVATAKEVFLYLHAKVLQQDPYPNENTRPVMLPTIPQLNTPES